MSEPQLSRAKSGHDRILLEWRDADLVGPDVESEKHMPCDEETGVRPREIVFAGCRPDVQDETVS